MALNFYEQSTGKEIIDDIFFTDHGDPTYGFEPRLTTIADDVAQLLLGHLGAHDVTRLALTSSIWRNHVRTFRLKILERTKKMYGEVKLTIQGRASPLVVFPVLDDQWSFDDRHAPIDLNEFRFHERGEKVHPHGKYAAALTLARSAPQMRCNVLRFPAPVAEQLLPLCHPEVELVFGADKGRCCMSLPEQWDFVQAHGLKLTGIHIFHFDNVEGEDWDDDEGELFDNSSEDPRQFSTSKNFFLELVGLPLGDAATTVRANTAIAQWDNVDYDNHHDKSAETLAWFLAHLEALGQLDGIQHLTLSDRSWDRDDRWILQGFLEAQTPNARERRHAADRAHHRHVERRAHRRRALQRRAMLAAPQHWRSALAYQLARRPGGARPDNPIEFFGLGWIQCSGHAYKVPWTTIPRTRSTMQLHGHEPKQIMTVVRSLTSTDHAPRHRHFPSFLVTDVYMGPKMIEALHRNLVRVSSSVEVHRWHYAYGTQGYATADALHEPSRKG